MNASVKPVVLICCTPLSGHVVPLRAIAKGLLSCGYEVTFVTGSAFGASLKKIGCSFVPLQGYADFTERDFKTLFPERASLAPGPELIAFDMINILLKPIPTQDQALQTALGEIEAKFPKRKVVLVNERVFLGNLPTLYGAHGVKPPCLAIGIIPLMLSSIDVPPPGFGLELDASEEGKKRNVAMTKIAHEVTYRGPQKYYEKVLQDYGIKETPRFYVDDAILKPDLFLQMCIPSIEYPRSDAPPTVRFAGGLGGEKQGLMTNPPIWWNEVVDSSHDTSKRIVACAQGTLAVNYDDLIIPTLKGLASMPDTLVVVALGNEGASLPPDITIPENCRIGGYIPYDQLFEIADVFVTNGGYGGIQHAISHGLPLVIGGTTEEKGDTTLRAVWAGVAVSLGTNRPTPEAVRAGVEEVFRDSKYAERARELESEAKTYEPLSVIVECIEELAARSQ